jgi:alcohol dehydrogenase (cytochrome c)
MARFFTIRIPLSSKTAKTAPANAIRAPLAATMLALAAPTFAADVTPERLFNPDREPQNWLMNHRTYDGQRFSPLARINKGNVKNLKLAYAVPLGGSAGDEWLEATPLFENGFIYITDSWGVLYKIDARSGEAGRIVWRMEPKQERQANNRGAALWGNLVISPASWPARIIATDKETGRAVWETAPGEPGSETWKDRNNAWQTGGGADWVTGTYDPDTDQTIWGTGNPVPMFDPFYRPGDNLYTNSAISWNPDTGNMNWYFQYTPGDLWDYDEVGTHIMIDSEVDGQPRKLITHSARNGHLYTMDRHNGQIIGAKPYTEVNWTRGIDQKTGRPIEYDPSKDIQTYAGLGNVVSGEPLKKVCPSILGGNNYWPSSYSPRTKLIYIPALTGCTTVEIDRTKHNAERGWNGGNTVHERFESNLTAVDPLTQEIKKSVHLRYPNTSGTLATGGGLVFLGLFDGTVAAFDDATLDELWKINVGSPFAAPPMTFEFDGKQYVAIASGRSPLARRRADNIPELKEQRNATVLFVFGL